MHVSPWKKDNSGEYTELLPMLAGCVASGWLVFFFIYIFLVSSYYGMCDIPWQEWKVVPVSPAVTPCGSIFPSALCQLPSVPRCCFSHGSCLCWLVRAMCNLDTTCHLLGEGEIQKEKPLLPLMALVPLAWAADSVLRPHWHSLSLD